MFHNTCSISRIRERVCGTHSNRDSGSKIIPKSCPVFDRQTMTSLIIFVKSFRLIFLNHTSSDNNTNVGCVSNAHSSDVCDKSLMPFSLTKNQQFLEVAHSHQRDPMIELNVFVTVSNPIDCWMNGKSDSVLHGIPMILVLVFEVNSHKNHESRWLTRFPMQINPSKLSSHNDCTICCLSSLSPKWQSSSWPPKLRYKSIVSFVIILVHLFINPFQPPKMPITSQSLS